MNETYEELIEKKQIDEISWLQFVLRSDEKEYFIAWCKEMKRLPNEELAMRYLDIADVMTTEELIIDFDYD